MRQVGYLPESYEDARSENYKREYSGYVQYITRHHTDRYIVWTDAQTTYSHTPEYDEACTPISSNCTSTVIDP